MKQEQKGFRIELRCSDEGWWHFNIELLCEARNEHGERIGFTATHSTIAEVGANLKQCPRGCAHPEAITLATPPCDHAQLFLYLIPHTLPESNRVEEIAPFPIRLTIYADGALLRTEEHMVNRWSGASIALQLRRS